MKAKDNSLYSSSERKTNNMLWGSVQGIVRTDITDYSTYEIRNFMRDKVLRRVWNSVSIGIYTNVSDVVKRSIRDAE